MKKAGFTLIEVLLVVVIILITTAIAIPSFSRSFKGAKIRAATRMVVMATRYARSVAVLHQVQTALLYDEELGTIEVVAIHTERSDSRFLNDAPPADAEEESATVDSRLKKHLEDGVRIAEVGSDADEGVTEVDGIYYVNFYPNGMCDQHWVELEDDHGQRVLIEMDPMSGKSTVEFI